MTHFRRFTDLEVRLCPVPGIPISKDFHLQYRFDKLIHPNEDSTDEKSRPCLIDVQRMSLAKWPSIVQRVNCQLYISRSRDPFLNLSIEHYLLTKTPAHSKILFLYYNKPCVVIGRNQNPWLEVNLHALGLGITLTQRQKNAVDSNGGVEFLRRRSGGGTVYHDEGNLNYCAICPSDVFTRDQHAEMVTRAIRHFNPRARVNQRHDIVLDQGDPPVEAEAIEDMHRSGYETDELTKPPMKMSGSAFKIVKGRGLHHGTCLLDCDRLGSISHYLHSPARGIISALGVESVRSPVGNAFDGLQLQQGRRKVHQEFQSKLFEGFQQLWNIDGSALTPFESVLHDLGTDSQESRFYESEHVDDWTVGTLTDDVGSVEEIKTGMNELKVCLRNLHMHFVLTVTVGSMALSTNSEIYNQQPQKEGWQ